MQGRREAGQPARRPVRRLDRGRRRPGRPRSARPIAGGHCPSRALDGAPGLGRGARPGGRRRALWEVTSASHPRLPSVPSMMLGPSCPVGRYRRRLRCRCRSRPAIGGRFTGDRASRWRADPKSGNQPAARSAASTAASRPMPDGISRRGDARPGTRPRPAGVAHAQVAPVGVVVGFPVMHPPHGPVVGRISGGSVNLMPVGMATGPPLSKAAASTGEGSYTVGRSVPTSWGPTSWGPSSSVRPSRRSCAPRPPSSPQPSSPGASSAA